jgi:hypothetical protein
MITVQEVIDRVQGAYSSGVESDDTRLEPRMIYSKALTARGRLAEQIVNKKQRLNQAFYQTLRGVELQAVSIHDCPLVPPLGCQVFRTKTKLPDFLSGHNKHVIQSVTSLDHNIVYSEETLKKSRYKSGNKYTSQKLDFYLLDGHIYVTHKSGPKLINITAAFQDPLEVYDYPCYCESGDCDDCVAAVDKNFHINASVLDTLVDITVQSLVSSLLNAPEDITNNSRDSREDQAK